MEFCAGFEGVNTRIYTYETATTPRGPPVFSRKMASVLSAQPLTFSSPWLRSWKRNSVALELPGGLEVLVTPTLESKLMVYSDEG